MVVWGIGMNTPGDQVATFAEYMGLTFPVLYDEQGTIAEDYVLGMSFPTAAMPQDWVVGTDGKVVYGNNVFELDELVSAIESEL